mmetsp:Transcript_10311/g.14914  ORF Transcript_10311/g.14914 Transcript_10311/m.14914 type:complete len:95 (+) Transcript_10311:104-388(+)
MTTRSPSTEADYLSARHHHNQEIPLEDDLEGDSRPFSPRSRKHMYDFGRRKGRAAGRVRSAFGERRRVCPLHFAIFRFFPSGFKASALECLRMI